MKVLKCPKDNTKLINFKNMSQRSGGYTISTLVYKCNVCNGLYIDSCVFPKNITYKNHNIINLVMYNKEKNDSKDSTTKSSKKKQIINKKAFNENHHIITYKVPLNTDEASQKKQRLDKTTGTIDFTTEILCQKYHMTAYSGKRKALEKRIGKHLIRGVFVINNKCYDVYCDLLTNTIYVLQQVYDKYHCEKYDIEYQELLNKDDDEIKAEIINDTTIMVPEKHIKASDFLIRTDDHYCVKYEHHIQDITGIIRVFKQQKIVEVEIPAAYCAECDVYYILNWDYIRLKDKGKICCRVETKYTYQKQQKNRWGYYDQMADKSILAIWGYNTQEKENLSDDERRDIIMMVLKTGSMSKHEVIDFLTIQINTKGDRFPNSKYKWQSDINWLRKVDRTTPERIRVSKVTQRIRLYN